MSRLFRTFLVLLLIAGLPARGMAAALMAAGFGHPAGLAQHVAPAPAVAASIASPQADAHHHHEGMTQQAGMQHVDMQHALAQGQDAQAAAGKPGMHDHNPAGSCGDCGDCCSVAALQSLVPAPAGIAPAVRVHALSLPLPASHVADLPVPPPNPPAA